MSALLPLILCAAGPLHLSLECVAAQTHTQMVMSSKDAWGRTAPAIRGRLKALDAYQAAIGPDLIVVWLNHRTVVITPPHTVCVPVWGASTCNVHVIGD